MAKLIGSKEYLAHEVQAGNVRVLPTPATIRPPSALVFIHDSLYVAADIVLCVEALERERPPVSREGVARLQESVEAIPHVMVTWQASDGSPEFRRFKMPTLGMAQKLADEIAERVNKRRLPMQIWSHAGATITNDAAREMMEELRIGEGFSYKAKPRAEGKRVRIYQFKKPTEEGVTPAIMAPVDMPGIEVAVMDAGPWRNSKREHPSFDIVPEWMLIPTFTLTEAGRWVRAYTQPIEREMRLRTEMEFAPPATGMLTREDLDGPLGNPSLHTNRVGDAARHRAGNFPGIPVDVAEVHEFPTIGLNDEYIDTPPLVMRPGMVRYQCRNCSMVLDRKPHDPKPCKCPACELFGVNQFLPVRSPQADPDLVRGGVIKNVKILDKHSEGTDWELTPAAEPAPVTAPQVGACTCAAKDMLADGWRCTCGAKKNNEF